MMATRNLCFIVAAILTSRENLLAAGGLLLNEYNAVGDNDFLNGEGYDSFFGRVRSNGRDWLELIVVDDHLDIRGWQLRWYQDDREANGVAVWDSSRTVAGLDGSQGAITFSDDVRWSNLRGGTILTISEREVLVDVADLHTDLSFSPLRGDWHLHVSTLDEADEASPLVTTRINTNESSGGFRVSHQDWEMNIVNAAGELVFGPIGEKIGDWGGQGLSNNEVGKLHHPTSPSNLEAWREAGIQHFRDSRTSTFGSPNTWNNDEEFWVQNLNTLRSVVEILAGDTNEDGIVDVADLNNVRNHFGTAGINILGDTNSNEIVDLEDLNAVRNNFGTTAGAAAVQEPTSSVILLLCAAFAFTTIQRKPPVTAVSVERASDS